MIFITPLQGFVPLQTIVTQGVALDWHYLEAFDLAVVRKTTWLLFFALFAFLRSIGKNILRDS